jgi:hypothetical protein
LSFELGDRESDENAVAGDLTLYHVRPFLRDLRDRHARRQRDDRGAESRLRAQLRQKRAVSVNAYGARAVIGALSGRRRRISRWR